VDAFLSDNPAGHLGIKFEADTPAAFLTLRYVGGDGQQGEAFNDFAPSHETSLLPCPLIVGVEDSAGHPVSGVTVTFKVERPEVNDLVYDLSTPSTKVWQIDIQTDKNGLAQVGWQLGRVPGCHGVDAFFTSEPSPHLGVKFEANAMGSVYGATLPRVNNINWINDLSYPLSAFLDSPGLLVDFTEEMSDQTANVNSFIVTVEVAEGEGLLPGEVLFAWHKPIVLQGDVTLTSDYAGRTNYRYQFVPNPHLFGSGILNQWLDAEKKFFSGGKVRVRVRLLGDSILNAAKTHRLDGNVFGPSFGQGVGGPPSGDGVEGGDFQSWFWLIR
jgi:hypothetical protein